MQCNKMSRMRAQHVLFAQSLQQLFRDFCNQDKVLIHDLSLLSGLENNWWESINQFISTTVDRQLNNLQDIIK